MLKTNSCSLTSEIRHLTPPPHRRRRPPASFFVPLIFLLLQWIQVRWCQKVFTQTHSARAGHTKPCNFLLVM